MNLKCMINGIEYTNVMVQGAIFSEEYNETLDSGSIILSHVEKIDNLLPYDDVFIYENSEHWESGFYRHLLVNNFSYERVNVSPYPDDKKVYFTYKIELFSETKGLETVQLPNISITQPKNFGNKKTKSVYYYLQQFVDMYSPKIKVKKLGSENEWVYQNKYRLSQNDELLTIFSNVYAPSFSLNSPNLRDVLAQLMLTKDMIPYVKDGEIYGMDITKRGSDFYGHDVYGDTIKKEILNIIGSRTSENHCDGLKRTYNNALSQETTCRTVEYIGFRNSNTSLLTLENMRLETRFPIYKINKIYACYYKKGKVIDSDNPDVSNYIIFLCKQDITSLVKLNSERQLLSKDWNDLINDNPPKNIEELSEYRMATIGYDIGSRYITGWGEKFEYIVNDNTWFPRTATYLENIITLVDSFTPLGIRNEDYFRKNGQLREKEFLSSAIGNFFDVYVNPFEGYNYILDGIEKNNKDVVGLKGIFFEIEYEGFYNGTVVHSKDDAYENIVMNDNSSASLTLLEKDGLFQKEKVNRFANEAITIRARHEKLEHLRPLGSVLNDKELGLEDIIIYHREYSIYDNFILATYYGTKDYVLKNYFTTVFSKHRPFNLLSYEESVRRSENKKMYLCFDTEKLYFENNLNNFVDFNNININKILSFFKYNHNIIEDEKNNKQLFLTYPDKINYGYIKVGNEKYASDINVFVCGDSLCFNMAMYDNVSGGIYISDTEPEISDIITDDVKKDYTGSIQDWYMTVDNNETGFLERAGFYFSHIDNTSFFYENELLFDDTDEFNKSEKINDIYERLFKLPKISSVLNDSIVENNIIGADYQINKDNKEIIDITYQIEPISFNNNVIFSPWMMKLSHLNSAFKTYTENKILDLSSGFTFNVFFTTLTESYVNTYNQGPLIILMIKEEDLEKIKINQKIDFKCYYNNMVLNGQNGRNGLEYTSNIQSVKYNFTSIDSFEYDDYNSVIQLRGNKEEIGENTKIFSPFSMVFKEVTHLYDPEMEPVPGYPSSEKQFELATHVSQGHLYRFFTNLRVKLVEEQGVNDMTIFNEVNFFGNDFFQTKDFKAATTEQITSSSIFYDNEGINLNNSGYFRHISNTNADPIVTGIEYIPAISVYYGADKIKKHLIHDEYENLNFLTKEQKSIEDIISIKTQNENYIEIKLDNMPDNTKSLQVWYYYEGSYKFVFGVNLTNDDITNGYVKIYVSAISNKDPRVYKSTRGVLDGYVQNLLESDELKYGEGQYYKKIKKQ